MQSWVSGSLLDPESVGSLDQDPDPGRQKLFHKKRRQVKKFYVLKCCTFSYMEGCKIFAFLVLKKPGNGSGSAILILGPARFFGIIII
jgi:hypothetical protein